MNLNTLRERLEPLPKEDRKAFVRNIGIPEDEIEGYIQYVFNPAKPKQVEDNRESKPGRLQEALAGLELLKQKAKANPPEVKINGLSPFELDVLHNRYLLGGETLLDRASYHNPEVVQTDIMQWLVNTFLPSGMHFAVLLGEQGAGKTYGALAYMNRIAKIDVKVCKIQYSNSIYIHAYKLSEYIHNPKKYDDELKKLISCGVLMLDDLGCEPVGYRGKDFEAHFGYLIGERHKFRKKTIITSNATPNDLRELYGDRVISRLMEVGLLFQSKQEDMRRAG